VEIKTLERIEMLYAAGRVKRLHTVPTLLEHTVGHHVYGSLILAMELVKLENGVGVSGSNAPLDEKYVLREWAIIYHLLYHDAPEVYTGDIPAPVKVRSPALVGVLEHMEESFYRHLFIALPLLTTREIAMVKACDTIDLAMNMLQEARMGNHIRDPYTGALIFDNCMEYLKDNPLRSVQQLRNELIYQHEEM